MDEKELELREENTFLYAEYATFYEEETANELFVSENVVLIQPGKVLKADFAEYIEDLNLFKMNNNVVVELENLDWLLDKKIKEELTNDDIKSSLNDKTTLYANRLIFDSNAKETKLIGNVKIVQSDKTILCDKMVLYDETSLLECIGNVEVIKENQDSMFTEHLLIDLKDEIFTAKKGVYSEYHLQN